MSEFLVYILKSQKINRYYIGQTKCLDKRLKRHNLKSVNSTKCGVPWRLIYSEKFRTRAEACRREKQIKSYKSGEAFKKLIYGV